MKDTKISFGTNGSRGQREDLQVLQMVINRIDMRKTYKAINRVDKTAFIIEFAVNSIQGGILRKYLSKQGLKSLWSMTTSQA